MTVSFTAPSLLHLLMFVAEIKIGDPDGHDPLVIARTMAQNGITLVSHARLRWTS